MLLILVLGYAFHLYYNPVGHLASLEGRNFAQFITTPLDRAMPFMPWFVLCYQLAYFAPTATLLAAILTRRADAPLVRRALAAFLAMLYVQYAIYLIFPVSASALRVDPTTLGGGFLDRLIAYQYRIATPWNACPSLHVSACWYFYRLFTLNFPRLRWAYLAWFAGMVVGTMAIKIHFALDTAAGLVIGASAYRLFEHLTRRGSLAGVWPSTYGMAAFYLGSSALALLGLGALIHAAGYDGPLYIVTGFGQ